MIKIGPVGSLGTTGNRWDDGGRVVIAQIFVSHGDLINSLQFQFVENGTLGLSDIHGADTGPMFSVVTLDYPSESLTGITGCYGWRNLVDGKRLQYVSSITFNTNIRTQGTFGRRCEDDKVFDFRVGIGNEFGGFHGFSRQYLHSIGIYLKPRTSVRRLQNA